MGYIGLIAISTLIDYFCGLKMNQLQSDSKRKLFLYLSLFSNLTLLGFFKYFNFFVDNVNAVLINVGAESQLSFHSLILPVGISFYTFQTMSYSIDVYKKRLLPEKNLGVFALYVNYFPQLVAGPIERATHLLPELKKKKVFNYSLFVSGLQLILWGMFKKVVVADRAAIISDQIFNNPNEYNGFSFLIGGLFFSFQIFCDFSGYTDIAIGSSRLLGIDLMKNFNRPYISKSISEFWSRWHISLSTWFRDYLYIPLGGNRVVKWRWYYNLFITFLISGLWHGANWTFILWGAYHGVLLIIQYSISGYLKKFNNNIVFKFLSVSIVFTLVLFGWIIFRSNNIHDLTYIFTNFSNNFVGGLNDFLWVIKNKLIAVNEWDTYQVTILNDKLGDLKDFSLGIFAILFMQLVYFLKSKKFFLEVFYNMPFAFRMGLYYIVLIIILQFGAFGESEFIYFQF